MSEIDAAARPARAVPHERFAAEVVLSAEAVADFALAAGDRNPLHHDARFAASSRYGRRIASGTQTTALLLGLSASHFAARGEVVGLEFRVRFRRPVYADERIVLEWLVVRVTPDRKLAGDVVELRGRVRGQDGRSAVNASGRLLTIWDRGEATPAARPG